MSLPKHAGWGGRRKGAGRKAKGERAGVTHARRPSLASRFPVHVTLRVLPHVWNLRSRRAFRVVARALTEGGERFGTRICEFSVQGNHMHLVVEALDARALSHGMQGFSVRVARGLNQVMKSRGRVLSDRFHARILRSPTEVVRALRYVRNNRHVHRTRWAASARSTLPGRRTSGGIPVLAGVAMLANAEGMPRQPWVTTSDPYSSDTPEPTVVLPAAHSYLLTRAQAQLATGRGLSLSPRGEHA